MNITYHVTITDIKLDKFDPKKQDRHTLEKIIIDSNKAALARCLLEGAPVGTQLHAHFQGNQLEYKNVETGDIITFENTYVKYAEGRIAAKPIRHSLIGAGAFGQVKLLIDLQTGNHIVAKEFFTREKKFRTSDRTQLLTSYYAQITHTQNLTLPFNGQISQGIVHKQRNPFKKLCQPETISPLNVIYGDTTFSFQITPEQKAAAQQTANKKANVNSKDETKPIIYFEYRGYDLREFSKNKQLLSDDILQLPKIIRESLHILHHAIHNRSLLHCDLKPENVLLLRNKNTQELSTFICDPDFVIQMHPETKAAYDQFKGTPQYFSPELCLYLTVEECRSLFRDGRGLLRRNTISDFADTIFPPNTNLKNRMHIRYSIETEVYSLGATWTVFFASISEDFLKTVESAASEKYRHLQKLVSLMTHYHPSARPNLILLQLAILPLEHDALSEEMLSSILAQQNLPSISLQNLNRLSHCMIQIAKHFDCKEPHPFHFLQWLYQYIQDKLITPDNNERDVTQFVEFVCFLHKNGPASYYTFDKALAKLNEFLTDTNHFYHFVEKYFFDHMAAFTISMRDKLALRWDHFAHENHKTLNYFTEILRHYAHADQTIRNANQLGNIIYCEITHRMRNYIARLDTDENTIFYIKNLTDMLPLLEEGKSIWEIISTVARSEALNEMQMALLFELAPRLHQDQHFLLFKKNLLALAVDLSDIDRLSCVSDYVIFYKLEERPINSSRLFQAGSQPIREFYEFYYYCALINCIYLTAKKIERFNDIQLQSDITKLANFLENVRNDFSQQMIPINELQIGAIRDIINKYMNFNLFHRNRPSQIFENASSDLLNELHTRYTNAAEVAPPLR